MFGPVMISARGPPPCSTTSLGTGGPSITASSTGCLPPRISTVGGCSADKISGRTCPGRSETLDKERRASREDSDAAAPRSGAARDAVSLEKRRHSSLAVSSRRSCSHCGDFGGK